MRLIDKDTFKKVIESLRDQYDYDVANASILGDVLNYKDAPTYDNSKLTDSIFSLLAINFPKDMQDIKVFCYDMDFGRIANIEGAIDELWMELEGKAEKRLHRYLMESFEEISNSFDQQVISQDESKEVVLPHIPLTDNEVVLKQHSDSIEKAIPNCHLSERYLMRGNSQEVADFIKNIEVREFEVVSPVKKRYSIEDEK